MPRIQFYSLFAAMAALTSLQADDSGVPIARIELSASQPYVLAGRIIKVQPTVFNQADAELVNRKLQWSVSDPNLASVDGEGTLRGIRPGVVDVIAADGGSQIRGVLSVMVYPGRFVALLSSKNIEVGDVVEASAQVWDADGNVIPGVQIAYSVGDSGLATASGSSITAKAEGRTSVVAEIEMRPGFAAYTTSAVLAISARSDYKVKRLVSTDTQIATNVSLGVPMKAAAFGNYAATITSLSNGGQGIVLSRLGQKPRILDSAGSTIEGTEKIIASFTSVAVNAAGDVAALAFLPAEWCEQVILVYRASSNWKPVVALDTMNCNVELQPRSLDSKGAIVYRAGTDLIRLAADGTSTKILTAGDTVAGLKPLNNLNGWGFTPFGNLVMLWMDTANVTSAVAWDGAARFTRIMGVGSVVDSRTLTDIQLPAEINAGDFISRVGSTNWTGIVRFKGSSATIVAASGSNRLGWIQTYCDGSGEDIYFHADQDGKTYLFHANGSNLTTVATFNLWRETGPLWIVSADTVLTHASPGGSTLAVEQFKGTVSTIIAGPGIQADGTAFMGLTQNSFPRGASASSPLMRTAGDFVMKWNGSGFTPLLKPGDTLPGNRTLAYIHSFTANRKGDFVISAQTQQGRAGLWAYRNAAMQLLVETDQILGASTSLTYQYAFAQDRAGTFVSMNAKGQVAAAVGSSNGSYLFLFDAVPGAASARIVAQLNASAPGGGNYSCCPTVNLDETGAVAFVNNVSGKGITLFYWDGSSPVRRIIGQGDTDPFGRTINWIYSAIGGSPERMYFNASIASVGTCVFKFNKEGNVEQVVQSNAAIRSGQYVYNVTGPDMTINEAGEILFSGFTPSGFGIMVRGAATTDRTVAIASRRTLEGDWLLWPFPGALTDSGDAFFPAYAFSDDKVRFGLYQATLNRP